MSKELFEAIEKNDKRKVESLTAQFDAIDGETNKTPLILAAELGHLDIVTILLQHSPRLLENKQDKDGKTALYVAAESGFTDVVETLSEYEEQTTTDNDNKNPLYVAVEQGHTDTVNFLIENYSSPLDHKWQEQQINQEDINGKTPLNVAARKGYTTIVTILLNTEQVTDHIDDDDGDTPLISAIKGAEQPASRGHSDVMKLLIEKGSKHALGHFDKQGRRPLYLAVEKGYADIVELIISKYKEIYPKGNSDYYILSNTRSPLHLAAGSGKIDMVNILLKTDIFKEEYLNYVHQQRSSIASMERGTPLHTAAYNGHLDVVKLLIGLERCELDIQDNIGMTPLNNAIMRGNVDIAIELINKGADVHKGNNTGNQPLHYAIGLDDVIEHLIRAGADINAKNNDGKTPLDLADSLLEAGAMTPQPTITSGGGRNNKKFKSNKRKSYKRKTYKRKMYKRKTYKRKMYKRKRIKENLKRKL
jgi:ankyrin repeat protein